MLEEIVAVIIAGLGLGSIIGFGIYRLSAHERRTRTESRQVTRYDEEKVEEVHKHIRRLEAEVRARQLGRRRG